MSIDVNRRFYREAAAIADGPPDARVWRIALDGKVVKTPARNPFTLPTKALAEAIAADSGGEYHVITDAELRSLSR